MAFDFQAAASATVGVQRRVLGPRLAGVKAGLLMNLNVTKLESGIKCFVLLLRGATNSMYSEVLAIFSRSA